MRVFFATDVHGSEICWRKFLNAGQHYKADVVILGGDMTGKALVPIIDDGGGRWHATLLENREEDEPDLRRRFDAMIGQVSVDPQHQIFSLHCPPYNTGLDDAPQLTAEMDLKDAGRSTVPVGSTAVREVIEEHQPALSLHGHIHEARATKRLGRTLCINPGSSYEQGQLLGAVVDLDGKKKVKRFVLTSG